MLARNETILKWALYTAAAVLCLLVQSAVLQHITLLGVIPFVYPLLAAIPATYETSFSGSVFALCMGVLADQLLPGPIPCFYTLIFPLVGLLSSLVARSLLPAGFLSGAAVTVLAFVLTDLFHCLILWTQGKAAWQAGLSLMARETLLSLPLCIPLTFLFRSVFHRTHRND